MVNLTERSVEFVMRRTRVRRCFMVKWQVLVWLAKDWWSSRSSEDSIVCKGLQTGTLYLPKPAHVSTCMLNVFICKLHRKRGGSLGGLGPVSLTMKLGHGLFHPSLPAVPLFPLPPFVILCHLAVCEEAKMFKGEINKTFFANKQISNSCLQLITLSKISNDQNIRVSNKDKFRTSSYYDKFLGLKVLHDAKFSLLPVYSNNNMCI